MNDRLQQALDGELAREALTPSERAELDHIETLFGRVGETLAHEELPDLSGTVMARIRALRESPARPEPTRRSLLRWLWAPQAARVVWRPAYALIGLLGAGLMLAWPHAPRAVPTTGEVLVQFRLDAPSARQVVLAGDFTNWRQDYSLTRSGPGVWTVVVPLEPGVHDYAFFVDDERWIPDPMAPAVDDGFGGLNSRISVLAPDSGRRM